MSNVNAKTKAKEMVDSTYEIIISTISDIEGNTASEEAYEAAKLICKTTASSLSTNVTTDSLCSYWNEVFDEIDNLK